MAKNLLCAVFLLTLAAVTAHAQTVTLRACNPGKTEVDVYFAQGSNVVSQHVAPADCAKLASSQGAIAPGVVAVGFTNVQGQWGGVHRYESLPDFGTGVAARTTEMLAVTHGAARASIPAQFRFNAPKPECITYTLPASSTYVGSLPLTATTGQRIRAQAMDNAAGPGRAAQTITSCDDFVYDLNVLAFPDTREIVFQRFCQPCDDQAEARKTPAQRAKEKQELDDRMTEVWMLQKFGGNVGNLPLGMRIAAEANSGKEESKNRYLELQERDPTRWDRIGWSDVPRYAREVAGNVPNVAMQGSVAVLQGTITGMQRHNASDPYYDVFFQESPDHKFILCTTKLDVLSDLFGANYSTAMVGKKIEVEGRVVGCLGAPGIFLKLAHQIKLVGNGPGMVAAVTPPAFQFPVDPDKRVLTEQPAAGTAAYDASKVATARRIVEGNCQTLYTLNSVYAGGHSYEPDQVLIKADAAACVERFDLTKLVPHQQAAMRYCLAHHNYTAAPRYSSAQDEALRAYNQCMAENDPVIIPCEAARRTQPPTPVDPCPQGPSLDDAARILRGDAGPIPSEPPGLPAIALPPSTAKAALAKAIADGNAQRAVVTAPVAAPAPVQQPPAAPAARPSAPAPQQNTAAENAARANAALERTMKTQACGGEAVKKLGPKGLTDPTAFQKAVQDCLQR